MQHENKAAVQIESILTELAQSDQEDKGIRQIDATHIQIKDSLYTVVVDYREGFDLYAFENRYQEYFEKFDFIVGDWGYDQLRLKGFYQLQKRKVAKDQVIDFLEDYIKEYCNFGCKYFVLAKDQEVEQFHKIRAKQLKLKPTKAKVATKEKAYQVQVKPEVAVPLPKQQDVKVNKQFKQTSRDVSQKTKQKPVMKVTTKRKDEFVIKQKRKSE